MLQLWAQPGNSACWIHSGQKQKNYRRSKTTDVGQYNYLKYLIN